MRIARWVLGWAVCPGMLAQSPVATVNDPGIITTRQQVTPAGVQSIFKGRVFAVSFCDDDRVAVVVDVRGHGNQVALLSVGRNRLIAETGPGGSAAGIQGAACTGQALLSTGTVRQGTEWRYGLRLLSLARVSNQPGEQSFSGPITIPLGSGAPGPVAGTAGGISATPDGSLAAIALTASNEVALVDLVKRRLKRRIPVGIAPFTAAVHPNGKSAWVSNWGGRPAKPGEPSATTGTGLREDHVLIDEHGIAASGTVSRIDLNTGEVTGNVTVGLHPTALAWDTTSGRLYVANGNSDSVSVVDSEAARVLVTWPVQPFGRAVAGIAPTSLVLSPDRKRLFVACGGINAVAVLDAATGAIQGLIPTGWYPSQIALSPNGRTLAVGTLMGVGSGSDLGMVLKRMRQELPDLREGPNRRYVHSYRGTVQLIPVPQADQLTAYTRAVAANTHLSLLPAPRESRTAPPAPLPVPLRSGDPSLIRHTVYIVKENRAYDQLFGDLGIGNGDPSLAIYGEDVATNHRALARQFVLLDNFFATGGSSGDGHQWVTQASETDYAMWPGYDGRSYPFDGNDPIAYAKGGFLWDAALAAGKTFADFGEFAPSDQFREVQEDPKYPPSKIRRSLLKDWRRGDPFLNRFNIKSPIPVLDAHLVRDYPSYGATAPDVVRARIFLRYLKQWEARGTMPNLVYIQMASDHTSGTKPGWNTPKANVADNDLALGQIVEGLSHSRFWPEMAIYVVEDDAQGGIDHVDGHRTIALAISPYIRRRSIDSTFYSHPSISRTIELQLGLAHLSIFDLIANDMRNAFQSEPDLTPYTAVTPQQTLFEWNPPIAALSGQARRDAIASSKMNWTRPDAVPARKLLEILWRNAKGYNVPVPKQRNAAFLPFGPPSDDDDEGEE